MEKSSFFNSVQASDGSYDREYLAEDFAKYFSSFIGNGVFPNPSTNLQVLSNNNMTVSIDIGKAYINGYYYENTTKLVKTIDVADGVLNRIDLVVLRLDFTNREIKVYVKEGTFASSPVAPSLQRDSDMYELGIAEISISAGATTITQGDITDLRLNNDYCGVVHGVVDQVDTTTIFNQFQAFFNEYSNKYKNTLSVAEKQFEQDFLNWFQTIKGILDTESAGHLQLEIDNLENKKSECKIGTATFISETTSLVIEDDFFNDNTFISVSKQSESTGTWTWLTESGKLTITSTDKEENDVIFNYCATKEGA